jgi:hypothetical protein
VGLFVIRNKQKRIQISIQNFTLQSSKMGEMAVPTCAASVNRNQADSKLSRAHITTINTTGESDAKRAGDVESKLRQHGFTTDPLGKRVTTRLTTRVHKEQTCDNVAGTTDPHAQRSIKRVTTWLHH